MFSLLYGLWKYYFKREEYFVLILGLDNAGKTTFLEQSKTRINKNYKGVNLNKITATVGLNIGRIDTDGIILNFWDLGGQTELQTLWDKVCLNSRSHLNINSFSTFNLSSVLRRKSRNYLYNRFFRRRKT